MYRKPMLFLGVLIVAACASPAEPSPTIQTPTPDEQTRMSLGSAGSDPGPTPTIEPFSASQIDDDHFGAAVASLEERIYLSGTIVLARLLSAEGDVPRFRAVEYLKGTGASEFTVRASTVGRDTPLRRPRRGAVSGGVGRPGPVREERHVVRVRRHDDLRLRRL